MAKPSQRHHRFLEEPALSPEEQAKEDAERKAFQEKLAQEFQEKEKQRLRREELLTFLEIPHAIGAEAIIADKLLEMLMDEHKFTRLVTKLRNKAFW